MAKYITWHEEGMIKKIIFCGELIDNTHTVELKGKEGDRGGNNWGSTDSEKISGQF